MTNTRAIYFCLFVAFGGWLFGYDIGVISVSFFTDLMTKRARLETQASLYLSHHKGCLIMPDFIDRFGQPIGAGGSMVLTSSRQSIITSLLSAGCVSDHIGLRTSTLTLLQYDIGRLLERSRRPSPPTASAARDRS